MSIIQNLNETLKQSIIEQKSTFIEIPQYQQTFNCETPIIEYQQLEKQQFKKLSKKYLFNVTEQNINGQLTPFPTFAFHIIRTTYQDQNGPGHFVIADCKVYIDARQKQLTSKQSINIEVLSAGRQLKKYHTQTNKNFLFSLKDETISKTYFQRFTHLLPVAIKDKIVEVTTKRFFDYLMIVTETFPYNSTFIFDSIKRHPTSGLIGVTATNQLYLIDQFDYDLLTYEFNQQKRSHVGMWKLLNY